MLVTAAARVRWPAGTRLITYACLVGTSIWDSAVRASSSPTAAVRVGANREGGEQQVGRQVGGDHGGQQPDAVRDARRGQEAAGLQHPDGEHDHPGLGGGGGVAVLQPVDQERLHNEAAAERVDGEQAGQPPHHRRRRDTQVRPRGLGTGGVRGSASTARLSRVAA